MPHKLPFSPADILLPKTELSKWSTIACDQFTSQSDYWESVNREVGDAASCYRITLPEIYLNGADVEKRITDINETMQRYMADDLFDEYKDALILVERTVSGGMIRRGLLGAFALEDYSYEKGAKPLIRPTEGTVLSRIPARVEIRRGAALELPHIMILMDDHKENIIESIDTSKLKLLYDFDLMLGGGHIRGWLLSDGEKSRILDRLNTLCQSCESSDEMLFAVGDGNHSLAAAKAISTLTDSEKAQYALAELVNIHNEGIVFEPIYRIVFHVNTDNFLTYLKSVFPGEKGRRVEYISAEQCDTIFVNGLEADVLQKAIDEYLSEHPEAEVDYIHGESALRELALRENSVGFLFDGMAKEELFDYVNQNGPLPRKTFSIGQAEDKRYYLEARKIR